MTGKTFELLRDMGVLDEATEAFNHQDEEKGGEGIALPNSLGGSEGLRQEAIDKNGEKGGR